MNTITVEKISNIDNDRFIVKGVVNGVHVVAEGSSGRDFFYRTAAHHHR